MRLGQLARKLALRPAEIVDFLARRSIQVDGGNNTRLDDEHVTLILQKYAPGELVENVEKAIAEEEINEIPTIESVNEAAPFDTVIPEKIHSTIDEEKIEVIKAPKIELTGLKVLGKIELPEPKKKEALANVEGTDAEPSPAKQVESRRVIRKSVPQRSNPRPAKNPIAEQREREAKQAEEKRKESLESDKEKRTLHYLKKVNTAQPAKPVKIKEEKIEVEKVTKVSAPTSMWGKLKRWLTS